MLKFREYGLSVIWKRKMEQGYYDYHRVEENFYKAIDALGEFDKRDLIVKIDLRVKSNYANWEGVDKVCGSLRTKISQYFLRRKSKYGKLPFVRSIEEKEQPRGGVKNHAHILVRIKGLKQYHSENHIIHIIEDICYGMDEVNSKKRKDLKPPVNIRIFPYWEDTTKTLGSAIEYICKTTTQTYNPLEKGIYKN